jgi:malate dehydrogenase (oxaloacetate-decarboxylating)
VTLAAVMAAIGVTKTKLLDQRIIIYGAGSAGLGITRQIRDAMVLMDDTSVEEANKRFWLIDRYGLIKNSLGPSKIRPELREFTRPDDEWVNIRNSDGQVRLLDAIREVKPTVLVGCSTHSGAFTEDVVREMAKGTERPIIFPLSNPSRLAEVDPKDANDWTGGKALLATGSPFPPCKMPNGKEYVVAECNSKCPETSTAESKPRFDHRCINLPWYRVWSDCLPKQNTDRFDDYRRHSPSRISLPGFERPG